MWNRDLEISRQQKCILQASGVFRYVTGEGGRRHGREMGWQRTPPRVRSPWWRELGVSDTQFVTKPLLWFSGREIYQRQWERLNIWYLGQFSKITVGVLLTYVRESWLAMNRPPGVPLGSTQKTPGFLACPCLLLLFFNFICLTGNQSSRTGAFHRVRKPGFYHNCSWFPLGGSTVCLWGIAPYSQGCWWRFWDKECSIEKSLWS